MILIVEDFKSLQITVTKLLNRHGYQTKSISTVQEARDYLKKATSPEVIILDINLPDGSGMEIIIEFKTKLRDVNVIITSQGIKRDIVLELHALGFAKNYISKALQRRSFTGGIICMKKFLTFLTSIALTVGVIVVLPNILKQDKNGLGVDNIVETPSYSEMKEAVDKLVKEAKESYSKEDRQLIINYLAKYKKLEELANNTPETNMKEKKRLLDEIQKVKARIDEIKLKYQNK